MDLSILIDSLISLSWCCQRYLFKSKPDPVTSQLQTFQWLRPFTFWPFLTHPVSFLNLLLLHMFCGCSVGVYTPPLSTCELQQDFKDKINFTFSQELSFSDHTQRWLLQSHPFSCTHLHGSLYLWVLVCGYIGWGKGRLTAFIWKIIQ